MSDDFNPAEILKSTNRHNKDINFLKKKISELESRVGDDAAFTKSFVSAQKSNKEIDESINAVIGEYDRHLLTTKGVALGKWLLVLILGAAVGWIINQAFSTASHSAEIEALKSLIEASQTQ